MQASEFIDHDEITATLAYAAANKNNAVLSTASSLRPRNAKGYPIAKQQFYWTANLKTETLKFLL